MKRIFAIIIAVTIYTGAKAQSNEDMLNLLIQKKVLSQTDADSLRAEAAIKDQNSPKDKNFSADLEIRPRTELRDGFRALPNSNSIPALFTSQRSRLGFNYKQDGVLNAQITIQDARVWGDKDPRSWNGTIQLFEAYAEPYINQNFSIKVGRQRLVYDNQRLFAENDWRVNANAHDAVNFKYYKEKLGTELAIAFNQSAENNFGNYYTGKDLVTGKDFQRLTYKYLAVHYFNLKLNKNFKLTTINALDAFQDTSTYLVVKTRTPARPEHNFVRYTDGGRLEYENGSFYATISGYYQWGKNTKDQTINAWYIQPEVKYVFPTLTTIRLGAEVFSGKDATDKTNTKDNSFVPLYGVAHRFNGNLEYFSQLPTDAGSAGLVNPYLFIIQSVTSKLSVRADFHYFRLENNFVDSKTKTTVDKYLGVENDITISYKANSAVTFDAGFSYGFFSNSFTVIKNDGGSSAHTPTWAFLQLKVTPQLFKARFK